MPPPSRVVGESVNQKGEIDLIIERLKPLYPNEKTALNWSNPFELLTAVILSAQCTDKRVNLVTEELFRKYRSVADYAGADIHVFESEVRSTGFFRNKTKNIIGSARVIIEKFGGQIPKTMPEILELPGIARKSANIILAEAYGVVEGVPVDTHVKRLTNRLGLTSKSDPVKIEDEMMKKVPRSDWYRFSTLLVYHGRAICVARKPKCASCVLNDICPSANLG